jgi:hypothetical protein
MRLQRIFLFVLLCFCAGLCAGSPAVHAHPIHIGLVQMDYNAKSRTLELSVKLFADDFESAVNKLNNVTLRLGSERELKESAVLLFDYVQRNMKISVNGSAAALHLLGKELEGEAVWLYVEIPNVQNVKKIALTNTLLFDMYDDQSNLVNISAGGQRKSAIFRKGKETATIDF